MSAGTCQAVEINFSSFKHSTAKNPAPVLQVQRRGGEACPVDILDQYISLRPDHPGPFFISSIGRPITSKQFREKLKLCMSFLSLDQSRYNTHSFRIGRATDMLDDGYTEAQIKAAGRWQSRAFIKYLRPQNIQI